MQSMHNLGVECGFIYIYRMDYGVPGLRGKRELGMVGMDCQTGHTIFYVYTTDFILGGS